MAIEQLNANETAKEAFQRLHTDLLDTRNRLNAGIADLEMAAKAHPNDWGVVGSLCNVVYGLEEIARFLNHGDGKD